MIKPIVSTIDKTELKKALLDWMVNDVSIDELHNVIPWDDELEALMYWGDVRDAIDDIVDTGYEDTITKKPWNILEVITDTDECVRFNNFVDEKVDSIVKVYDSFIERANGKKQLIAKNAQSVDDVIKNTNIADIALSVLDKMFVAEYAETVFDIIIENVIADVSECADEEFSDDDVRLAVNRVILKKLGVSV